MGRSQDRVAVDEPGAGGEVHDLSLREAARLYGLSLATLGKRVRWGQIDGYKTRGPWGYEWRVSRRALEAYGYREQPARLDDGQQDPRVAALEREVASLRRVAAAERLRADRADRELGQVLLECGRLRGALARALGTPAPTPALVSGRDGRWALVAGATPYDLPAGQEHLTRASERPRSEHSWHGSG